MIKNRLKGKAKEAPKCQIFDAFCWSKKLRLKIFNHFAEWYRHVSSQPLRLLFHDLTITHFQGDGMAAAQTGRIAPDRFSGKKPADCQRFEASFLLTPWIDRHRQAQIAVVFFKHQFFIDHHL